MGLWQVVDEQNAMLEAFLVMVARAPSPQRRVQLSRTIPPCYKTFWEHTSFKQARGSASQQK